MPTGWFDRESENSNEIHAGIIPATAIQKREAFEPNALQTNFQGVDLAVEEFTVTSSYKTHEIRALPNATESSLIQGNEIARLATAGKPEHISIQGGYAFIAEGNAGLEIVDISNASNPIKVGSYQTTDFVHQIKFSGNYAYVAAGKAGLSILDIKNINNISLTGSLSS